MKKYISVAYVFLVLMLVTKEKANARSDSRFVLSTTIPADDAKEIINDIIAVIGLKPNFEVKAANIPNAAAVAYYGKRYIIYNPQFITRLNAAAGNKWASVSVLAHEIGHHLNGHTLINVGSQPGLELEADEFSGFILRKLGATLSQSQVALKLAASYKTSLTHPGQQDRLTAVAAGWNNGDGLAKNRSKYNKTVPQINTEDDLFDRDIAANAPQLQQQTMPANENSNTVTTYPGLKVLDSRYIMGTVNFPSDKTGDYYLTVRYNLVKVVNGEVYLVAKMLRTNNDDYPYVLKGDPNTFFVDKYGKIVTANKQLAGYLRII